MFKTIVLALDGSDQSLLALKYAKELAEKFEARLIMVHVFPHTSDLRDYEGYDKLVAKRKSTGQEILENARTEIGSATFALEEDLLEGPAADAILSTAKTRSADLIVMGTRGMGSFEGLLFGSVSSKVAHYAPCPVMVVR